MKHDVTTSTCDIVSFKITESRLGRMRCAPVEFDDDPEEAVVDVVVDVALKPTLPLLARRCGQPVSPLHASQVTNLQRRLASRLDVAERRRQFRAPSVPAAVGQCSGQPRRSCQPSTAR
jgi:hypothetical protein